VWLVTFALRFFNCHHHVWAESSGQIARPLYLSEQDSFFFVLSSLILKVVRVVVCQGPLNPHNISHPMLMLIGLKCKSRTGAKQQRLLQITFDFSTFLL
jgi:hypothetical protein